MFNFLVKLKQGFEGNLGRMRRKNIDNEKIHKDKDIVLLKLARGNYFGDEDGFMSKIKNYSVKACTNNVQVFVIEKDVKKMKK